MSSNLSRAYRSFVLKVRRWAPIPVRLIVGYGFMAHGYAKLVHGPQNFISVLHALHVPLPALMGWATIAVELVGGLAVLLGALVPLASLPMAAVLLVAALTVHLPYGFSSIKLQAVTAAGARFGPPGYEVDLLYLACLATLILGGSGPWAIDGFLLNHTPRVEVETDEVGAMASLGHRTCDSEVNAERPRHTAA